jgi:hypothetical protein
LGGLKEAGQRLLWWREALKGGSPARSNQLPAAAAAAAAAAVAAAAAAADKV